ncbi:hypothetical protein [Delftia lacustris]|uniref:Uncharacterized protein n=1 Tax=Delftia lacustris TaxID=558537 RepID=A0A1H3TH27_9BURK|nr:hypothetical protein [Delftia lacustris]SDZ49400.1 hypothetical protein SAMN05421547_12869 [Delftia lacustris]
MQLARITHPTTPLTDRAFIYRRSEATNVAETFAKAREQLASAAAAATPPKRRTRKSSTADAPAATKLQQIPLELPSL